MKDDAKDWRLAFVYSRLSLITHYFHPSAFIPRPLPAPSATKFSPCQSRSTVGVDVKTSAVSSIVIPPKYFVQYFSFARVNSREIRQRFVGATRSAARSSNLIRETFCPPLPLRQRRLRKRARSECAAWPAAMAKK